MYSLMILTSYLIIIIIDHSFLLNQSIELFLFITIINLSIKDYIMNNK
jgi:hypothetical protein